MIAIIPHSHVFVLLILENCCIYGIYFNAAKTRNSRYFATIWFTDSANDSVLNGLTCEFSYRSEGRKKERKKWQRIRKKDILRKERIEDKKGAKLCAYKAVWRVRSVLIIISCWRKLEIIFYSIQVKATAENPVKSDWLCISNETRDSFFPKFKRFHFFFLFRLTLTLKLSLRDFNLFKILFLSLNLRQRNF